MTRNKKFLYGLVLTILVALISVFIPMLDAECPQSNVNVVDSKDINVAKIEMLDSKSNKKNVKAAKAVKTVKTVKVAKVSKPAKTEKTVKAEKKFSSDINIKWLQACIKCKEYLRKENYTYDMSYIKHVPLDANKEKVADCSSYVSWVLYEYGFKEFEGKQFTSVDFRAMFTSNKKYLKKYIQRITNVKGFEDLKLGDILVYRGHVEIYVGPGLKDCPTVYSCGCNASIKAKDLVSRSSRKVDTLVGVLRIK